VFERARDLGGIRADDRPEVPFGDKARSSPEYCIAWLPRLLEVHQLILAQLLTLSQGGWGKVKLFIFKMKFILDLEV
jgi:hypothetical protein